MNHLILIKHSKPEIIPEIPAAQWLLSEEGRSRCTALAHKLAPYTPTSIFSSLEPKAQETAQLVGQRLNLPFAPIAGLHEHERHSVSFGSHEQFEACVARFFTHPDEMVYGEETARQAEERFAQAVLSLTAKHASDDLLIVAHGTVITLFVARTNPIERYAFWKNLGLPSFVVLSMPELKLASVTEKVI